MLISAKFQSFNGDNPGRLCTILVAGLLTHRSPFASRQRWGSGSCYVRFLLTIQDRLHALRLNHVNAHGHVVGLARNPSKISSPLEWEHLVRILIILQLRAVMELLADMKNMGSKVLGETQTASLAQAEIRVGELEKDMYTLYSFNAGPAEVQAF